MSSGYGRGGRGAALYEALNNPPRKPGESSPSGGGGDGPAQQTAPRAPGGRGALLQALQQRAAAATTQATQPTPAGRGMAAMAPMGRAGLLQSLQQQTQAPSAGAKPKLPMGRGLAALRSLQTAGGQSPTSQASPSQSPAPVTTRTPSPPQEPQRQPSPPHRQPSPPQRQPSPPQASASPPQAQAQDGEPGGRLSKLEYMLHTLELQEQKGVMRREGEAGTRLRLSANYIAVNCRNEGVYQYAVQFSPQVDSRGMRFRLLYEHSDVIGATRAFDGSILFLPHKLPQTETVFVSTRQTDGEQVQVKVKLVKALPPQSCVQLYNVIFRKIMAILKMCQVGRHYYDPHRPTPIPQHKLEVWPGYITACAEYEGGLMLLTDVSHRVLRTETARDLMGDIMQTNARNFQEECVKRMVGCTVLTRYNNKTYRIDDIAWDKSPREKFTLSNGTETSFVEYYKQAYNKDIKDVNQPLLIHRPKEREKRQMRGGGIDVVCLVPEFCYLTGLTDEMRADFRIMKDLATHTRVSPQQRQLAMRKFCENVNSHPDARAELEKWGLALDMDTIDLMGRRLPEEEIVFKNRSCRAGPQADWGRDAGRNQMLQAVDLDQWIIFCTRRDANKARDFVKSAKQTSRDIGMRVNDPFIEELQNDRTDTYITAFKNKINDRVQMVVFLFPTSRDDRYNAVKKMTCITHPVPSQVINARTVGNPAKLRSVAMKIMMQINCKMGGALWALKMPPKMKLMVIGVDVYHEGTGSSRKSVGGFVASLNTECTRWHSRVAFQAKGVELFDSFKTLFIDALRQYHQVNHELPNKIVVFRDGVGDGQIEQVRGHEVPQLSSCFQHFGESYNPGFAVVIVQKRINTRIFGRTGDGPRTGLENPGPGTIVDTTITRKNMYDFFLVSQHVRQGTVSPTHYIVAHDAIDWKVDHIQRLSYKMTHLYYNWPGTIRVPAPCQYAHKLAYLVGQNIRDDPKHELSNRLFFL